MPDIRHRIPVSAQAGAVMELAATGRGFAQWWAEDVVDEPENRVSLGFFNRSTIYRLRLVARSADTVSWRCESGDEWHETELRFVIRPEGKGVAVEFVHAGWRDTTPYFVSCNTTWGELMYRLKAAAEGQPRGPLFRRDSLAY